nr:MAG TPA: hypothetical protein [Microviridae sp.]
MKIMKKYIVVLVNEETKEKYAYVFEGTFDRVYKNAKSCVRKIKAPTKNNIYIKSINKA